MPWRVRRAREVVMDLQRPPCIQSRHSQESALMSSFGNDRKMLM